MLFPISFDCESKVMLGAQGLWLGSLLLLRLKARTHWADFLSADCNSQPIPIGGFKILNMFDSGSRPTITESVVYLADSGIESDDSTANSAANSLKIGLWVRAFSLLLTSFITQKVLYYGQVLFSFSKTLVQ